MSNNFFIVVIGLSGVGKTTFCNYLAECSKLKHINSGDALHAKLRKSENVLPPRFKHEVGDIFLKHNVVTDLYYTIHDYSIINKANIIDGIRMFSTLEKFINENHEVLTILIELDENTRVERIVERCKIQGLSQIETKYTILKKDAYVDELREMKKYANFVIDNSGSCLKSKAQEIWDEVNKYRIQCSVNDAESYLQTNKWLRHAPVMTSMILPAIKKQVL